MILVRDFMSVSLVTVTPLDSLGVALDLMRTRRVRHLCVMEHGRLGGVATDRDLHAALPSPHTGADAASYRRALDHVSVARVMVRDPITATPDTPALQAVALMRDRRIGCLPVMDGPRLVGIVTRSDCLELLARQLGLQPAPASAPAPTQAGNGSPVFEIVDPFWSSQVR